VGIEPEWKVDKQPAWLVAAIKKTITDLDGGMQKQLNGLALLKTHCLTAYVPMVIRFSLSAGQWSYSVLVGQIISPMR
jgi:hypothetical protein